MDNMNREQRYLIFKAAVSSILQTIVLPTLGLAFNVYLFDKEFSLGMDYWHMLYLGAILRILIYIITRTVKYDWRD